MWRLATAFVAAPPGLRFVQRPVVGRRSLRKSQGEVARGLRPFGGVLFQTGQDGILQGGRNGPRQS